VLGRRGCPQRSRWETRNTFLASSWPQASMNVPWHTNVAGSLPEFKVAKSAQVAVSGKKIDAAGGLPGIYFRTRDGYCWNRQVAVALLSF